MRALVTGGAGFIGSHLVDRLVDEGWDVLVVDTLVSGHLANLADARRRGHIQFHQLDIRDDDFLTVVERFRPEEIYHMAAQASVAVSTRDPMLDASVNILGTINVLEAAKRVEAVRVVAASSGGAIYGGEVKLPAKESYTKHPDSPYGISKKVVEDYFRYYKNLTGVDYVLVAFSNVYGPRQDPFGEAGVVSIFTNLMLEGKRPVIYGDGDQTRDYVFVTDVADACVRAGGIRRWSSPEHRDRYRNVGDRVVQGARLDHRFRSQPGVEAILGRVTSTARWSTRRWRISISGGVPGRRWKTGWPKTVESFRS